MPVFNLSKLMIGMQSVLGAYVSGQSVYGGSISARIVRSTGIVESGDAVAGYTYTGTGAGFTNFGIVDYVIPVGSDGYYQFVQPATPGNAMIGITTSNTPSLYSGSPGIFFGIYADVGAGNKYTIINNRASIAPTLAIAPQAGDFVRIRVAGTSIFAEVSKNNGVSYSVAYTWTGVASGPRYCLVNMTNTGSLAGLSSFGSEASLYASHNYVMDGNSLVAGAGSTAGLTLTTQAAKLSPLNGTTPIINLGVGGQTARMMNGFDGGSSADIDAAFVAGRKNILLLWEGTNSIVINRTAAQALQDMSDYIAARRLANAWDKVVVIGTIPRYQTGAYWADIDVLNAHLVTFNESLSASPTTYGADAYVDVRASGSPFALPDYSLATFERTETLPMWATTDTVGWRIHLSNAGYAYIAQCLSSKLKQII